MCSLLSGGEMRTRLDPGGGAIVIGAPHQQRSAELVAAAFALTPRRRASCTSFCRPDLAEAAPSWNNREHRTIAPDRIFLENRRHAPGRADHSGGATGAPASAIPPGIIDGTVMIEASTRRAVTLIGSIYDCALDPSKWEPTLAKIVAAFNGQNAVLGPRTFAMIAC